MRPKPLEYNLNMEKILITMIIFKIVIDLLFLKNHLGTVQFWNQKNDSSDLEQLDFKIFESTLTSITDAKICNRDQ